MMRAAFELSPIIEEEDEAAFRDRVGASLGKHADDIAELHELVYMTVQAAAQQWEALSRLCTEFEAVKPATEALEQRVFELRSEVCAVRGVLGMKRDSLLATSVPEDGVTEGNSMDLPDSETDSGENVANPESDGRNLQPKERFKLLDTDFLSSRLRDGQERLEVAPVTAPPRTVGSLVEPRRADGPLNVENTVGFVHRIQVQSDVDVLPERRLNDTEGALMESRCADVLPKVEKKFGSFQRKQAQYQVDGLPPEHDGVNDFPECALMESRCAEVLPKAEKKFGSFQRKQAQYHVDVLPPEHDGVNAFTEGALMESRCAEVLPKAEKKFGSFQRKQAQYHVDVLPPEHDGVNAFTEGSRRLSFERSAKSLGPICLKEFKPHQRASETENGFCHVELAHGCDLPELDEPDFELEDRDLDRLLEEAPIAVEGVTSHPRTGAMWKRSPDHEFDPDDHEDALEESHALRVRLREAFDSTAAEMQLEAAEAGAEQMEFMLTEPWAEEVYQL